jgi:hypothetical protein
MTFAEIYGEVITARFKSSQTASAKRWVNMREGQIWAAAEWPWKIVSAADVTATTSTPTLDSSVHSPLAVYDDIGNELEYMIAKDFDEIYIPRGIQNTRGRPEAFKWNNNVLTLGDYPDHSYALKYTYLRKQSHYASGAIVTVGAMSADSDYPLFDSHWHEVLTIGALSTGLKVENDPTWEALEQEFSMMVAAMIDHYLPAIAVAGNMQYGADGL